MIRAFLALPIPEPLEHRLSLLQDAMQDGTPVPVENFHLTLAFLGEQAESTLDDLDVLLAAAALPMPVLRLTSLAAFGGRNPRALIALFAPDPRLMALQSRVARLALDAGIPLQHRRFTPHVTLIRFAQDEVTPPQLAGAIAAAGLITSEAHAVAQMHLMRSRLLASGAAYDPLARYRLTA